ncbi:hypothetical protein [Agromyces marinus]|uniref:SMI1/KNR4 family protein n=1 Tax=Agromyces marinus TaxID=1389020 RepID=A0ABN6Y9J6_9MICO|nr:hypothetical protein [Agromyces marinus]UIP58070.1 hypothetical protein DSM26151_09400 [Agromyces marinus]BDZ53706.1 hypothetical protein GCM10025870_07790 [Agromyces marinus]
MNESRGGWRRYDNTFFPVFHERFEERWGEGTAPFLEPAVYDEDQPRPRAQWINVDTGAAVAVVPVWEDDPTTRSFAVFYLPPSGGIWVLRPPGLAAYIEEAVGGTAAADRSIALRNDSFRKAVAHAEAFIFGR